MKVLVACEFSGVVRDAFLAEGHDAISCDLLPTESPGPHIQGDVRELLREPWGLVIAHPPCTFLASSRGGRHGDSKDVGEALDLFLDCLHANAPRIAVENPQMYHYCRQVVGEPSFRVHPFYFGDLYLKRTYFWTENLPPLLATHYMGEGGLHFPSWVGGGRQQKRNAATGGRGNRSPKERARFWPGMAAAMAKQWGNYQ